MFLRMLWLTVWFFCFVANSHADTANKIYSSLGDKDKGHFLRYYLAKGFLDLESMDSGISPGFDFPDDLPIPTDFLLNFENMKIEPKNFSVKFLKDFAAKYKLTLEDALQVARNRCNCFPKDQYICTTTGNCINISDVGSICCT